MSKRMAHKSMALMSAVLMQAACSEDGRDPAELEPPPSVSHQSVATSLSDFFIIGADGQRASTFAAWKARGINTMVRWNQNDSCANFDNTAIANGLKAIRVTGHPSSPTPSEDAGKAHLIATAQDDEPEMGYPNYTVGRAAVQADNDADNAAGKPFFSNHAGPWIRNDVNGVHPNDYCGIRGQVYNQWCYGEYFAAADWIGFDLYPKNSNIDINSIEQVIKLIQGTGTTQPILAYIEASDFDCLGGYPNQWHITYQSVLAVIAGAKGVIYFPHKLGPTSNGSCATPTADGTTLETQNELTWLHAAYRAIPPTTLNGTRNPTGVTFESGTTTGQIRWGTRKDATHAYYLTLNDHDSTAYNHVVRFHGINNCTNKAVTVYEAGTSATRTVTLNSSCVTTTSEGWSARRWKIYKVPVN